MTAYDRQRLLTALILLVIAAFVASGYGPAARWRRQLRTAAVIGFAAAALLAVGEIAFWLLDNKR